MTVFDFPLVRGDAATALRDPGSIVLTEEMAEKYFGTEDPVGKVIEADPYNSGTLMLFKVTGVTENVPPQSHFHFIFSPRIPAFTRTRSHSRAILSIIRMFL